MRNSACLSSLHLARSLTSIKLRSFFGTDYFYHKSVGQLVIYYKKLLKDISVSKEEQVMDSEKL
jgi:hypothetical protein